MATITITITDKYKLKPHVMKAHHDEAPTMLKGWDENDTITLKNIAVGQRYSLLWWAGPGKGGESFKLILTATEKNKRKRLHKFKSTNRSRVVIRANIARGQTYTAGHRYFLLLKN